MQSHAPQNTQSTCPYCGVGCGVVSNKGSATIAGDLLHPANFGRLCVKGTALAETLNTQGRLLQPVVDGMPADWTLALTTAASRLKKIIAEHGPGSVAMYLSGQLLTEDYYVANKLLKGFIGSSHLDTNSRLCMASTVAGHKRAFGEDVVPGCYEDLELADLTVLVGSNLAWAHPVLFQRLLAAKAANPEKKIVVIDPRRTATAESADLFLPIRPGTDVAMFSGLLAYLARQGQLDTDFTEQHCTGLTQTLEAAQCWQNIAQLADYCDVPVSDLTTFFQWFGATARTVTVFSQGINQAANGTDKVNAIINVHLATGRIGKPGACPLSVTGQPNAMGGREVGALANQLAGHLRFPSELTGIDETPDAEWQALRQFWRAPDLVQQGGYTAVDLFAAIGRGEIKAVWIMATNPVVSMPQADLVKQALQRCELVLVSDIYQDSDTVAQAHIVFPALGFAEKDGTVTNSERRISRQRAFLPAPGEARADWQIVCDVAKALGFAHGFNYQNPAQIFREHAALTTLCNNGRRALDLTACRAMSDAAYDAWQPQQWPLPQVGYDSARLFANGQFYTADRKAKLVPLSGLEVLPRQGGDFVLNSGRIRDQWHTMTRTGRVPALMQHQSEPFVAMHPNDARRYQLKDGDLVELSNALGIFRGRAQLTDAQRCGELFVPMHWSGQFGFLSRCDVLYDDSRDPISRQPAFKQGQVQLKKLVVSAELVLFSRQPDLLPQLHGLCSYVVTVPHANMSEYRMALTVPANALAQLISLISHQLISAIQQSAAGTPPEQIQAQAPQHWRQAYVQDDQLQALLYAGPTLPALDRVWLNQCFANRLTATTRRQLLRGALLEAGDCSALVCSCFQVRQQSIQQAITKGARCSASLGQQLKCGTGCGSCLPEIRQLLQHAPMLKI